MMKVQMNGNGLKFVTTREGKMNYRVFCRCLLVVGLISLWCWTTGCSNAEKEEHCISTLQNALAKLEELKQQNEKLSSELMATKGNLKEATEELETLKRTPDEIIRSVSSALDTYKKTKERNSLTKANQLLHDFIIRFQDSPKLQLVKKMLADVENKSDLHDKRIELDDKIATAIRLGNIQEAGNLLSNSDRYFTREETNRWQKQIAEEKDKPIALSIQQYCNEVNENEARAKKKYLGRRLTLTGTVENVESSYNSVVVNMDTEAFSCLRVEDRLILQPTKEQRERASKINKGESISATCKCTDTYMGLQFEKMKLFNCIIN